MDGQADDADEAVITSNRVPGSDCHSDFSDLEESDPTSEWTFQKIFYFMLK